MKKHFSNKSHSALGFSNKNSPSFKIHPKFYGNDILSRCHADLAPGICPVLVQGIYKTLEVLKLQTLSHTN